MYKIEIIDITLETNISNYVYQSNTLPTRNDIVNIENNNYIVTELIHNVNSEIDITLLAKPIIFEYEGLLN